MMPGLESSMEAMGGGPPVRVARHAMATRFEVLLQGERPGALRAAGEEALDEIERLENLLSLYRPHSDIARINSAPAGCPVRVAPETFRLLERSRDLTEQTLGAFDITAGPLVRAWGFHGGAGHPPDPGQWAQARETAGWSRVILDPSEGTVRFAGNRPGLLDLGAIGKGYALDRAAEILREAGVSSALLHGGTSTVVALGAPPDTAGWPLALATVPDSGWGDTPTKVPGSLSPPPNRGTGHLSSPGSAADLATNPMPALGETQDKVPGSLLPRARHTEGQLPTRRVPQYETPYIGTGSLSPGPAGAPPADHISQHVSDTLETLRHAPHRGTGTLSAGPFSSEQLSPDHSSALVTLRDASLSVSAVWGRGFQDAAGNYQGHVLDPRTGEPVVAARLAAVVLPSAAESDAVSTALLVLGRPGITLLTSRFVGLRCWVYPDAAD